MASVSCTVQARHSEKDESGHALLWGGLLVLGVGF